MISRLKGTLLTVEPQRVEVETPGGVVYEVSVPLSIAGRLPSRGSEVEIRTLQVVKEDSVTLYGFVEARERELFSRLLEAKGVGGALALKMLSAFSSSRLARALAEKDFAALTQVSGIGKKKAERIFLELSDKVQDLAVASEAKDDGGPAREAVSALVSLGYSFMDADEAVQNVLDTDDPPESREELIRRALAGR